MYYVRTFDITEEAVEDVLGEIILLGICFKKIHILIIFCKYVLNFILV